MATPKINFTSLDFDDIKQDLIDYITSASSFTDANNEGSNLNLMVGLLAYITNLLGYNLNQGINETYIDTVELRQNILKIIKILNYKPYRRTSAAVSVDLSSVIGTSSPKFLLKYDRILSGALKFYYTGTNVEVTGSTYQGARFLEGTLTTKESALIGDGTDFQFFNIDDPDIGDFFQLYRVNLDNSRTYYEQFDEGRVYVSPSTQLLYFVEEVSDGYKISFGNGKLGFRPAIGEVIGYDYIKPTADQETNKLVDFTWDGGGSAEIINAGFLGGHITQANAVVSPTLSPNGSIGGGPKESIEEIRFNAPKFYQSQSRAVTESDYFALALKNNLIQKAEVVGGDKLSPLELGKVYITVKPDPANYPFDDFTTADLAMLKDYFDRFKVVTIQPILRNPMYIHVVLSIIARYTAESSIPSVGAIKAALDQFVNTENSNFGDYLEFSKLVATIDKSDVLITSNLTTMKLYTPLKSLWVLPGSVFRFKLTQFLYNTSATGASKKTYIQIYDTQATGGPAITTTLYEGIDYQIEYQADNYVRIFGYGTGLLTDFVNQEYRFHFFVQDDDVFLNNSAGQIFLLKDNEVSVSVQKVVP